MSKKLSRRSFLKSTALTGALTSILTLTPGAREKLLGDGAASALEYPRVDKPPYEVEGEVGRFDNRNNAHSRGYWDESQSFYMFGPQGMTAFHDTLKNIATGTPKPGFDHRDLSLFMSSALMFKVGSFAASHLWEPELPPGLTQPYKTTPEEAAQTVKMAAKHFGASVVGTCKLNRNWLYSHRYHVENWKTDAKDLFTKVFGLEKGLLGPVMTPEERKKLQLPNVDDELPQEMNNVIVCGIEMDYEAYQRTLSCVEVAETYRAYSFDKFLIMHLALFINYMGYRAWPFGSYGPGLGIPMAVDAGLGEMGRNGLLINPDFGPRLRICGVITDMPIQPDKPIDMGVTKFCETCAVCADNCPSGSIPKDNNRTAEAVYSTTNSGVKKWPIDACKCKAYWDDHNISACGNCVHYCPYNKPKTEMHKLAAHLAPTLGSTLVKMEKMLGYSEPKDVASWWAQDPNKFFPRSTKK